MKPELDLQAARPTTTDDEGPSRPDSGSRWSANWVLILAACAGLGVGAGASFAVGKGEARSTAHTGGSQPALAQGAANHGPASPTARSEAVIVAATSASTPPVSAANAPPATAPSEATDAAEAAASAALVEDPSGEAPQALDTDAPALLDDGEAPMPQHDPARVAALVKELGQAHATLHATAEASAKDKATAEALDKVFAKDRAARRFAREFYASFGSGRFVRAGALTPLGVRVVELVESLERHAIDASGFERESLRAAIASLGRADGDEGESGVLSIVRGLLSAPTFEAEEVRDRVAMLAQLPEPGLVAMVAASFATGKGPTASDAVPDAVVFRAFLDLALEFRFLRKAGPTTLRTRGPVFERESKRLKDFMAEIVTRPRGEGVELLIPPHPQYAKMVDFYETYRELARQGGCEKVPTSWRFRPGAKSEEVKKLQARLACQGFYAGELDGRLEGETLEALESFQRHHDIPDTGIVQEDTIKALNVSMDQRVKQIALTLQRMREARFDRMGDFFIRVNIPAFMLKVFDRGEVVREQRVIVGTNKLDDDKVNLVQGHINRTKLLGTRLYEVIVNPTWILPKRVEEGLMKTAIEKDADYLTKSNIRKVKLGSGTEVFVQGSGDGNVLGKVKFLLEESNAIYLHDTDKRELFRKQRRDFSHGCIRVDQAIDFGKWLLVHDGWPQEEVDRAFAMKSAQRGFKMRRPVHTVFEYMTVDVSAEGKPIFYADVYGYDSAYFNDRLPVSERTRWGDDRLRPRWVPLMPAATVNEWRAQGKPAPRNLGPDGKPKPEAPKGKGSKKAEESGP